MPGDAGETWVVVLAAGDGTRLQALTTTASGTTIPKQFCSLYEGPSLLHEALRRARAIANAANICVVVAEKHRHFWGPQLWSVPPANIIVQPTNRGTALGVLLPLLTILRRDPAARIVLLPSDHLVRHETVLAAALADAVGQLRRRIRETVLLGIEPEAPDAELGYIVPGPTDGLGARIVERFIEKPPVAVARELVRSGALWNAFIVAASAEALLALFERRIPSMVEALRDAVARDLRSSGDARAIAELYERSPIIDFSRDILEGTETQLRVVPVRRCGWSDLGTPWRVADALRRAPRTERAHRVQAGMGYLSLAAQHARRSAERAERVRV